MILLIEWGSDNDKNGQARRTSIKIPYFSKFLFLIL